MSSSLQKKIWIDLDNSPHVPFFKPIIEELLKKNYGFTITARDCFQVCGLADLMGMKYTAIGKHYGKHKIMKIIGTLIRVMQTIPTILREKPDIAVSHGSRTQQIVANLLRIPNIVIFDYEHTSSLVMLQPTYVLVPEIIAGGVKKFSRSQLHSYPGIKEDVYVPAFKPDSRILTSLGLSENDIIGVIRPPATEAHYRNPESDMLFSATIETLAAVENVKMVMLPRNDRQGDQIRREWSKLFSQRKIIFPEEVVDGLNLIWHSDFLISGGGTMNRESAALGVPVYSIFRGKTGAVDRYLADNGRLILLESVEDVRTKIQAVRRSKKNDEKFDDRPALKKIVSVIEKLIKES